MWNFHCIMFDLCDWYLPLKIHCQGSKVNYVEKEKVFAVWNKCFVLFGFCLFFSSLSCWHFDLLLERGLLSFQAASAFSASKGVKAGFIAWCLRGMLMELSYPHARIASDRVSTLNWHCVCHIPIPKEEAR